MVAAALPAKLPGRARCTNGVPDTVKVGLDDVGNTDLLDLLNSSYYHFRALCQVANDEKLLYK
jgi:hypothetical protein